MKKPVVVLAVLAAFMAGFDHLLRYKLLVQIKHPVHQPPFFRRSSSRTGNLKNGHIIFPFCLPGQSGQFFHRRVPLKIKWCLHYHEEAVLQNINLHFKNTHFPDTRNDLRPSLCWLWRFIYSVINSGSSFRSNVWQYLFTGPLYSFTR